MTHTHPQQTHLQRERENGEEKQQQRKKERVTPASTGASLFCHPPNGYFLSIYHDARQETALPPVAPVVGGW